MIILCIFLIYVLMINDYFMYISHLCIPLFILPMPCVVTISQKRSSRYNIITEWSTCMTKPILDHANSNCESLNNLSTCI